MPVRFPFELIWIVKNLNIILKSFAISTLIPRTRTGLALTSRRSSFRYVPCIPFILVSFWLLFYQKLFRFDRVARFACSSHWIISYQDSVPDLKSLETPIGWILFSGDCWWLLSGRHSQYLFLGVWAMTCEICRCVSGLYQLGVLDFWLVSNHWKSQLKDLKWE